MEEKKEKEEKSGFLATDLLSMLKKQLRALWVIIILLLVALVGTNMAWLWVFQSYDYVTVDSILFTVYDNITFTAILPL